MANTTIRPGGKITNQYRIEELLGQGAFGSAYLALDVALKRRCVIKELRAEHLSDHQTRQRFINEARTMAGLTDPHIVVVHHLLTPESYPELRDYYIVMEYMEGGSLDAWRRHHEITINDAVRIAADVCLGLERAHRQGIYHRDVKPANILLNDDGSVIKVADWGLAHRPDTTMTILGSQPGTLRYMAAEQAAGASDIDGRCDQYSVGAMLFYMITANYYLDFTAIEQQAFYEYLRSQGISPRGVLSPRQQLEADRTVQLAYIDAIMEQPARRPRELNPAVPQALEDIILRALQKEPRKRFASAAEMANTLLAVRAAQGDGATSSLPSPVDRLLDDANRALNEVSPSAALTILRKALAMAPSRPEVYRELARIHNLQQRHDEACRVLQEGLNLAVGDTSLLRSLGFTYEHMGRDREAIEVFERLLRQDPAQPKIITELKRLRARVQR